MSLKFYTIPVSLYCAKTRILLRFKQVEWEEVPPPGGYGSDEYKRHVASGNLPALQLEDFQLADSEAIAEFLEDAYPNPSALPQDTQAKAKIRELSRFHDTRLEPALRALFKFISKDAREGKEAEITALSSQLNLRLNQLGDWLATNKDYLPDDLTLADCGFPITFLWMKTLTPIMDLDLLWPDAVQEYEARLHRIKAVAEELTDYTPKLESFLEPNKEI